MFEIRSLTSLRAAAAFAIVYSHVYPVTGLPFYWMHGTILSQGVSFFFVLSGFILSVTYDKADLFNRKRNFYIARLARVYPLYLAALLMACLIRIGILDHDGVSTRILTKSIIVEGLALQAWFPHGFWPINGVGWSISVEMFFYMIFPFVKRSRLAFATATVTSIGFTMLICIFGHMAGLKPGVGINSFYRVICMNPLVQSMEFLLGVRLGAAFAGRSRSIELSAFTIMIWSLSEIIAIAACFFLSAHDFEVWASPLTDHIMGGAWKTLLLSSGAAPAFGLLIWVFAHERGIVSRAMRWQPFVFLGGASYALYLTHELVFETLGRYGALPLLGTVPFGESVMINIGLFGTMLAVASAGHLFIERPTRKWLRSHRPFQVRKLDILIKTRGYM